MPAVAVREIGLVVAIQVAVLTALSVLIALPVLPARTLEPILAVNPEQGEQVGWREFTASVAAAWQRAGPDAVIFTGNYGRVVVVGKRAPVFTGCRVMEVHHAVVENEEDGTEIAVCDPVVWSQVWPIVRRFYG